ncbi:MAG: hypothetical protein WCJ42_11230 [Actinomycetes bacterium]
MATGVYVDGFNLYYGARVSGTTDPGAPNRQELYLRALRTLPDVKIHFGVFHGETVSDGLG